MLDGKEFQIPSTIDDETIISELQEKFEEYRKIKILSLQKEYKKI